MRLDEALVARGLSRSRSRARDQVRRGCVTVNARTETKPARMVGPEAVVALDDPAAAYVSRAAFKLAAGLDAARIDVAGMHALDVGASTGGFTQCLLERGATHVVALDVGAGQLAPQLRDDPRVTSMEGVNARDLFAGDLPWMPDVITVDVSFISLMLVLPAILPLASPDARGVFLFKPQFEVGKAGLGKGGIVRDQQAVETALAGICCEIDRLGWSVATIIEAPIAGGDGNQERLIAAQSVR